ncbi:transcriptional regulator [Lipingzhangella rawalii]|uniref:transcriptional regulator n=1 Tax=Lipingzhangella rawalii TaxID=2055835 RepID=UPI00287B7219|nr:transcriptional regulator [Lipingzhangella rawalii]
MAGNTRLKAARQHAGYSSQRAFADALNRVAQALGLSIEVSLRQVRRWESATPPWPRNEYQQLLTRLLHQRIEDLGFAPPWETSPQAQTAHSDTRSRHSGSRAAPGLSLHWSGKTDVELPATAGTDFAEVTAVHRRFYSVAEPASLHAAAQAHAALGLRLLESAPGERCPSLAQALAETFLLVGRLEFFDLDRAEDADETLLRALQVAGEAGDALLGSAILAHSAFIPGWVGRRSEAAERMRAARAYARRANTPAEFLAWLDAVEAECETRCGYPQEALRIIAGAEERLGDPTEVPVPEWFTWFTEIRLRGFKGNTELMAGYASQARTTLSQVLEDLPTDNGKQRAVTLADLAHVEVAAGNPETACTYATMALEELNSTWYATGMQRILHVRDALHPWAGSEAVHRLDDRLYDWQTTVRALRR